MTRELPTNDLISERLGAGHPVTIGWNVLLECYSKGENYKTEDGKQSLLVRPDSSIEREKHQGCIGRILMIGSAAFKGEKFKDFDTLPQVGDYIKLKKYTGTFNDYTNPKTQEKIKIIEIEDVLVLTIAPSPSQYAGHNFLGN
jgi:co-chaperonin GroES (HSP10)